MPTAKEKHRKAITKRARRRGLVLNRKRIAELRKDSRTMSMSQLARKYGMDKGLLEEYLKGGFDE